ncbi:penicillin-binding protein 1A [Geomicrobium halophilum]|uniref:Penicillin-binding protein 1A n=1 Tax=Geomicrobium halophilum TaxID=549000 RepID=A0A841PXB2_9BACL|nr:PBP1A family penicillin-binding protein [Geomicrobium halophilum]MBB6449073.1 penicillin-binding protein 1A [Geomicrobium halophilum]
MSEYRSRAEKRHAEEQKRNKKNKQGKNGRSTFKKIMISILIVMLIGTAAGTATAVAMIRDAPPLDPDELMIAEGSTILDMNDNEIGTLQGGENRSYRDINEMPEHLKDAFIAVEDYRFYDHSGIDLWRIGGAIAANITGGFGAEGASTITQQLVKQAFLSPDQTIKRKVQEQWLAIQMEQQYSKDEILEMYLNISYFDSGAWGVGEAAIRYFNKEDISELTIADSAVLAAIPRRPSHYNPENNPEANEERRNLIISLMEDQELITSEEASEAKAVNIEDQLDFTPAEDDIGYQSFIDHVMDEVENIEGIEPSDLYAAGFDIYTTLDPGAQDHAQNVIQSDEYIHQYPDHEDFQVGFTLLDTETGAVRAMVGNREESEVARGLNYATTGSGHPGSTIKPLLDYGPGIDTLQWSTGKQFEDEPHQYSNGEPITNYSNNYSGNVSMREALVRSLNIPAVKALQEVGLDNAQNFAEGLGLNFDNISEGYALGGTSEWVSSLDMAGAYAAFGNDGVYNEPYSVRTIEFRDGREIDLTPDESERAMNDYTAFMMSDMLKDVLTDSDGTGQRANVDGLPLAGKTGTSNFTPDERQDFGIPEGGVPDIWFNGYTTRYTAAVWTGFSERGNGYLASGEEQQIAKDIFRHIMANVHQGGEVPDFTRPDSVCGDTGGELYVCGNEPIQEPDNDEDDTEEMDESISDLSATYQEDDNQIIVSWDFPEDATFSVRHSTGDEMSEVAQSSDLQYILTDPEPGTHTFEVEALDDSSGVDTAQVSVEVTEAVEEEEDEINLEEEESPEEGGEGDLEEEESPEEGEEGDQEETPEEESPEEPSEDENGNDDNGDNGNNDMNENDGNGDDGNNDMNENNGTGDDEGNDDIDNDGNGGDENGENIDNANNDDDNDSNGDDEEIDTEE